MAESRKEGAFDPGISRLTRPVGHWCLACDDAHASSTTLRPPKEAQAERSSLANSTPLFPHRAPSHIQAPVAMEPWQSWGLFLTLSIAAYFYYSNQKKATARPARTQSVAEDTAVRPARKREEAKPKRKTDGVASGSDAAKGSEKNRNKNKKEQKPAAKAPTFAPPPEVDDDEKEDKEWARQLAELKKGTNLAPPERKVGGGARTVKQRAANADRAFTSGSSTNGADADAEFSPAISPALNASASGRDISDMLEAPSAGPSVLRLTEPTGPAPAKKQQKKASPEPKETKKQRQNRKKVEQAKALREEDEAARKVLMEQQRRTAREARGEPAKNGLGAPTSAPSAWTQKEKSKANGSGELLDTFDNEASNLAASGTSTNWERDLPSEEEQMRLAMEDSTWSTVETKGKKGKKKTAQAEPEAEQYAVKTPEVRSLPLTETTNTSRSNTMSSDVEPTNGLKGSADISDYIQGQVGSHPQDSDWAVV
ncbi:hypothetical protein DBV05_g3917 [Lasiodiplodia theobromae]|uniref:Uncharacterized protein n=1 Tax=Lasiodiplodia theobromae TaxID=45133 RepID=A0A5N5DKS7_9PEZI|nr:hypothetical protein DBV05_g3917 [Lasiodiplodia theobromae]